ncbi:MAG: hypothetical protein GEU80_01195 [Dehalococcoidia bacterium]|nr:hypothetical protein [Dehalococcoidia bacterium]
MAATDAEEISDIRAYVLDVSQQLRQLQELGPDRWREPFETGLRAAYRRGDLPGLATLVNFAVGHLDGAGRTAEAVQEIDHALALCDQDPDVRSILAAMRAGLQISWGHKASACGSMAEAAEAAAEGSDPYAAMKFRVYQQVLACRLATDADDEVIETLIAQTGRDGYAPESLFLLSWYIPYLYATGQRRRAVPWIRQLRIQSELARHPWRQIDAASFEVADAAVEAPAAALVEQDVDRPNWLATWRRALLEFRGHLLRRDWEAAGTSLQHIEALAGQTGALEVGDVGAFRACLEAHASDGTQRVTLERPGAVHLGMLPAALAGAEAVALAGTQSHAAQWLDWVAREAQPLVATLLEWPVSRARIQALLAMRAGHRQAAKSAFKRAHEWAKDAGYAAEAGLALVQHAELLAHGEPRSRQAEWTAMRHRGWDALVALQIDPAAHAYAATRAIAATRNREPAVPRLTPRELEALTALADGLTYREAGERLQVKWRTVQTLARRAYVKLDTNGRGRAVARARELGLL